MSELPKYEMGFTITALSNSVLKTKEDTPGSSKGKFTTTIGLTATDCSTPMHLINACLPTLQIIESEVPEDYPNKENVDDVLFTNIVHQHLLGALSQYGTLVKEVINRRLPLLNLKQSYPIEIQRRLLFTIDVTLIAMSTENEL